MSLDVVCPHCDFRLQLPMNMAGRNIRCPNTDCGIVFEVPPPVAEIIPVSKPREIRRKPPEEAKPKPKEIRWTDTAETKPKEIRWDEAPEAKPKEIRWDEKEPPKAKPVRPRPNPAPIEDVASEEPIRVSKRRKNRSPMILAGLVVLFLFAGTGLGLFVFISRERGEKRLAESAEQAYSTGDFGKARRDYTELANNYEGSEKHPRYAFLANLSQLQSEIQQLGQSGHPDEALASFAKFLEQYSESSFSKPGSGFGLEIVQLGQKLAGIAHSFCLGALNEHRGNRSDSSNLDHAAQIGQRTRALLIELERIRDKDSPSSKDILQKFDAFEASTTVERQRSASLKAWRAKLTQPSQAVVDEFQAAMAKLGLAEDANTVAWATEARRTILERILFTPARRPAQPFPAGATEPAFAATPITGSPKANKPDAAPEQTCFAVSEGCLFACDAHTGGLLWGRRIAEPSQSRATLDLPSIVTLPGSNSEVALVAFPHGLAAFRVRTGEPVWYQTLPAACRARPAIVGNMVFAGLLDAAGTIATLNLSTGEFLGSIAIQQPHGANVQVIAPGTDRKPQLLAVGEARLSYLFEIGAGDSEILVCTRGIVTNHAASAVLIDPLIVAPAVPGTAPRVILTTATGSETSKLTMYSLPTPGDSPATVSEWIAPKIVEKSLMGWPWYPMTSDGERLAFTTDSGMVGWYGWKAPADGVFPMLPEPVAEPGDSVSRSCIVAMADDSLWAISGENLVRFQASVGPQGLRMIAVGKPRRVGEAIGRAQVFPRSNLAVVHVKPASKSPGQFMAFDTERGDVLWQVDLNVK